MLEAIVVGIMTQAAVLVLHELVRYVRERVVFAT